MAESKRRKYIWRGVFAVSLALNLLFAGMIAGAAWRLHDWYDNRGGLAAGSAYIRALDHESKHALVDVMRDFRHKSRGGKGAHLELYGEVLALLRADTVDEAALYAATKRHADLSLGRLEEAHRAVVAHLAGMSAARRRAYADRLEHAIRHRGRHKRHRD